MLGSSPTLERVPPRALALSLGALLVPVAAALFVPEGPHDYELLLWLLALVPAFLLAYYRGWRGVAAALALGMAVLALTHVAAAAFGRRITDWPLAAGVLIAYIGIALGVTWLAERMHKDRIDAERLALTDALTGLPNRRHALVFLDTEFAAAQRGRRLTLVMFDIDHFKQYNDRYGHVAGDEALRAVGEVLHHITRRMNLSARWGGEEFVSILSGNDEEGTLIFVDRVRDKLRTLEVIGGAPTVSAGIASYQPEMRSPEELIAAADQALYQAKVEGRDAVRIYSRAVAV